MQETKNALVELSKLPVSIIIVGLGNEDFTGMTVLDGDTYPIVNTSGQRWERDIVQFVKYNDYKA